MSHAPQPIPEMPSSPATRLHDERLQRWHQNGQALLTFENARSWLNAAGLVLFTPRPQIPAPAPTFVEAVLGSPLSDPSVQQTDNARSLLARLIAEGIAVPLNLLGAGAATIGDTPDYIASAGVFSYVFTLRGDKTWKQAPTTTGATKVSQLAAHTYDILLSSEGRSAGDLAAELGNGVTESAVLRALGELWTHLRVLPLPQADGRPSVWELASTRYTKQIKAGANAGQPSALSALVSLYLGQVAVATEQEIEIFLSPLAPRSRTRDVLHALTAARQLDGVAIEGRTMLHLAADAPGFLSDESGLQNTIAVEPIAARQLAANPEITGESPTESGQRIKKYVPSPRKLGTGPLAKGAPAKSAVGGGRNSGERMDRPNRNERPGSGFHRPEREDRSGRTDRERRPFQKSQTPDRPFERPPRFDRPWEEDRENKPPRSPREGRPTFAHSQEEPRRRPAARGGAGKPDRAGGGWKPTYRDNQRPMRDDFRERSAGPRKGERAEFAPRRRKDEEGARPARFDRAGSGATKAFRRDAQTGREGERPARPFRRFDAPARSDGKSQSFREDNGRQERPFRPRREGPPSERREGRARPAKFTAKGPGGPRREGYSSRTPGKGFSPRGGEFSARRRGADTRPFPKKGASGARPPRRTFKRKEDESA